MLQTVSLAALWIMICQCHLLTRLVFTGRIYGQKMKKLLIFLFLILIVPLKHEISLRDFGSCIFTPIREESIRGHRFWIMDSAVYRALYLRCNTQSQVLIQIKSFRYHPVATLELLRRVRTLGSLVPAP